MVTEPPKMIFIHPRSRDKHEILYEEDMTKDQINSKLREAEIPIDYMPATYNRHYVQCKHSVSCAEYDYWNRPWTVGTSFIDDLCPWCKGKDKTFY